MVQKASSLKGKTIVVTRPREQALDAGRLIEAMGGKPYFLPTIEIKAPPDFSATMKLLDALTAGKVDFVILMSVNGVRHLLEAADSLGIKDQLRQNLRKTAIMAVGPKTAEELEKNSIRVDLIPEKYTSEGILQALQQHGASRKTIYIPRTSEAPPELAEKLREKGSTVVELHVYESQLPHDSAISERFLKDLTNESIDAIVFSSSLGAKNFTKMLTPYITKDKLLNLINGKVTIVAIGPVTTKTLTELGLRVDVIPEKHLFEEALNALAHHLNAE